MNIKLLKKFGLYAGILLLFIGLAYGFTPEVLDGKIVNQGDISQWKGMANEAMTHNAEHPEDPTAWSNAMFGGMPTTATIDSFDGDYTDNIYDFLLTGRRPASYLLLALIGGFLLMLSLGTSTLLAVGGAIAMTFCSYNFQIIEAGHNTKMQAIAYFPWVLAAVIFTYKSALKDSKALDKKWWLKIVLGAVLFAFALSFQIKANHIQITYYLGIVIFAFILGLLIYLCINKVRRCSMMKNFFIASGLLLVFGGVGIATNANKLIPTYEYSKYTMRGGSELSSKSETHNKNGLDLEYATQWSYGIEEMPNLLIPNYNGGGSVEIDKKSEYWSAINEALKKGYVYQSKEDLREYFYGCICQEYGNPQTNAEKNEYENAADSYAEQYFSANEKEYNKEATRYASQVAPQLRNYWGPQPFTSGPMYMGAVTIFLFILGAILCKGREKWWLIAAIVVSIFLAWGNHFMWHTKLWFEYAPMYSKFRTVSMALVVLQVALPMLGFVVLDRIMKEQYEKRQLFKAGGIALGLTAGFCLLCILMPNIGGTYAANEEIAAFGSKNFAQPLMDYRKSLMTSDAVRSLLFILIAAALIALPYLHKNFTATKTRHLLIGGVILVALFDLWSVGKRYLNDDDFVTKEKFNSHYNLGNDPYGFKDSDKNFRVLDIPNISNAVMSYYYKCIGGYSAVKMQRYDDLLNRYIYNEAQAFMDHGDSLIQLYNERQITEAEFYEKVDSTMREDLPINSMLNAKYVVSFDIIQNPYAFGNCWFVNDYTPAQTPDEELQFIGEVDLYNTAVIGNDFAWARKHFEENPYDGEQFDSDRYDDIKLTHYAPNELRYEFSTNRERAVIFSEIYYPKGWKAWVEPAGAYGKVVDGRYQPTSEGYQIDLFRANWILRGAIIPEGEGTLVMRFEPESYRTGETVSRISSILLILLLLGAAGALIYMKRK